MISLLAVASGGALGAVGRHGVNSLALHFFGEHFPWGTLGVNVIGSFLVGVIVTIFDHYWTPPEHIRYFLVTGMIGAFTTFSTFSLDLIDLWERQQYVWLAGYALSSIILSVGAIILAFILTKSVIS